MTLCNKVTSISCENPRFLTDFRVLSKASSVTDPSTKLFPPLTTRVPPILIKATSIVSFGGNVIHSPDGIFCNKR